MRQRSRPAAAPGEPQPKVRYPSRMEREATRIDTAEGVPLVIGVTGHRDLLDEEQEDQAHQRDHAQADCHLAQGRFPVRAGEHPVAGGHFRRRFCRAPEPEHLQHRGGAAFPGFGLDLCI